MSISRVPQRAREHPDRSVGDTIRLFGVPMVASGAAALAGAAIWMVSPPELHAAEIGSRTAMAVAGLAFFVLVSATRPTSATSMSLVASALFIIAGALLAVEPKFGSVVLTMMSALFLTALYRPSAGTWGSFRMVRIGRDHELRHGGRHLARSPRHCGLRECPANQSNSQPFDSSSHYGDRGCPAGRSTCRMISPNCTALSSLSGMRSAERSAKRSARLIAAVQNRVDTKPGCSSYRT